MSKAWSLERNWSCCVGVSSGFLLVFRCCCGCGCGWHDQWFSSFQCIVFVVIVGVVKITKIDQADGKITSLEGEYLPEGDFKAAKRKLSWLASVPSNTKVILTEFDHLVTKEKLEEDDKFEDFVNPITMATTEVLGDAGLKTLQEHEVIQLERRGYYRVDRPYVGPDKPLILYMIPDGKTKAMSGQSGKLAHH